MSSFLHELHAEMVRTVHFVESRGLVIYFLAITVIIGCIAPLGMTLGAFMSVDVGKGLGFFWGVADSHDVEGSIIRSAFAGTGICVPGMILYAIKLSVSTSSPGTSDISRSRGAAFFPLSVARLLSGSLFGALCYAVSCLVLLMLIQLRGGFQLEGAGILRFLSTWVLNVALMVSLVMECMVMYQLTGSALLSGSAALILFYLGLQLYPAFYSYWFHPYAWCAVLPGPYFGAAGALGFQIINKRTILFYSMIVIIGSMTLHRLSFALRGR